MINIVIIEVELAHSLFVYQVQAFNSFFNVGGKKETMTDTNDLECYILDQVLF